MISRLNRIILFTISLLLTGLFSLLLVLYFYGITVPSFSYKDISVNGLYIKLDKKFIVEVEKIQVPFQGTSNSSVENIQKDLQYIPLLKRYFQKIDIKELIIAGEESIVVYYDNENLYIDNHLLNLSVKPEFFIDKINLELYSLYLKDYDVVFSGEIKLNTKTMSSLLSGNFYYKSVEGTINTVTNKEQIEFHVDSSNLSDIKFVKDFIVLKKEIESWMYDNVKGEFKLNYLTGIIDISEDEPKLLKLEGDAQVKNATIKYHKKLANVKTELLKVKYKDDNLYFEMDKPTYKGIKIYGSDVVISSLTGDRPFITINIKTKNKLTPAIVGIVQAYGGAIPITQLTGTTNSKLSIKVDLYGKYKTNILGNFKTKKSTFKIKDFIFTANDAVVKLNNDNLKILNSSLQYDNNLSMKLNLNIDLKTKKATGIASKIIYSLKNDEYNFIDLDKVVSNIKVDFTKNLHISIEELDLILNDNAKEFIIKINDIAKLSPYSQFLQQYKISQGKIDVAVKSKEKISFNAFLNDLELPLIQNGKKILQLDLVGDIDGSNIYFTTKDKSIKYSNKDNILHLNKIDIIHNLDENENENSSTQYKNIQIKGKDSNIILNDKYILLSNKYDLMLKDNIVSQLQSEYFYTKFDLTQDKDKNIIFNMQNITPKFFQALTQKEFIKSGIFHLKGKGVHNLINGTMQLDNIELKPQEQPKVEKEQNKQQQKSVFDKYLIKKGDISYSYNKETEILNMHKILTKGKNINLDGKIELNFQNNAINGILDASFLKEASKLIGYVPLVNYIILGKDKRFSVKVKVKGTFDDIKISTDTAKSTIKAPISIFGRIITLPVKVLKTIVEESKK